MNTKATGATVATMMGTLAVAYALDRAFRVMRRTTSQTLNSVPSLVVAAGGSLSLAGVLLGLAWLSLLTK